MPHNFSFVIPGVLAGMERPGTFARLRDDFEFLKEHKVGAIVSLTEAPLEKAFVEEFGFRYLHLPVLDFTPPTTTQIDTFLKFQRDAERNGIATVVHCGAGLGRTGTMLACALVNRGFPSQLAIDRVRLIRPYSIETIDQEDRVRSYDRMIQKRTSDNVIKNPNDERGSTPNVNGGEKPQ